jgi:hypothetical protein
MAFHFLLLSVANLKNKIQITCLFWFESSFTLHRVEESRNTPSPLNPLVPEAKPTLGFRKWVTTILSTTQVSTNVVLLALMFIYRLKKLNPTVKGKPGSEYRLLTVALMLGNKFLDDNTYTNKTWAEVSGISVSEIHIMEVEFLSNMRYTLYASKEEWNAWEKKLGRFWDYFDRASKAAIAVETTIPPPTTPTHIIQHSYPSTPIKNYSSSNLPTTPSSSSARQPHPLAIPPYLAPPPQQPSPIPRLPNVDSRVVVGGSRKRSYDDSAEERPSKRLSMNMSGHTTRPDVGSMVSTSMPMTYHDISVPLLPLPSQNSRMESSHLNSTPNYPLPQPTVTRSMASVYTAPAQMPSMDQLKSQVPPTLGLRIPPMMEQSPNRPHPLLNSRSSSPTTTNIITPTSDLLSPLAYNYHRSSPYKPVRSVNTLLVPPPSASLQNPSQNIGSGALQYRPLTKNPVERRVGVVPYMTQGVPQWPPLHEFHRH